MASRPTSGAGTPGAEILITGATGYVGRRLITALEERHTRTRCLARHPDRLRDHVGPETEIATGDLLDPASLASAFEGIKVAFYLVHSMEAGKDFEARDRQAVQGFVSAARSAGVRRVIYLGALGHGNDLSPHLASRQEVGRILREALPTIEFRASIIIGSGSLSFEVMRALVDRLPIMVTPRWVRIPTQPIAIDDVVSYLIAAIDLDLTESRVYEIGGSEVTTYGGLMKEYARQRGLHRILIPVPLLTPWLSSLWLRLVTPVHRRVGRALILGLKNPTTVQDPAALRDFSIRPLSTSQAITRAIAPGQTNP